MFPADGGNLGNRIPHPGAKIFHFGLGNPGAELFSRSIHSFDNTRDANTGHNLSSEYLSVLQLYPFHILWQNGGLTIST
jgi:hypothetical protein